MPKYRGLDKHGVMHAIMYRGAAMPWCLEIDAPEPIYVSPMSFPPEEPLTCTTCMNMELREDLRVEQAPEG